MIIITESIDASVGAAFFTEGFPFYLSLSVFGVVSTRKFPIARENSQVFYVCFLLCVGTQDSLLSTYNYVILELLRCEDKKRKCQPCGCLDANRNEQKDDRVFPILGNGNELEKRIESKGCVTHSAEPLTQLINFSKLLLHIEKFSQQFVMFSLPSLRASRLTWRKQISAHIFYALSHVLFSGP